MIDRTARVLVRKPPQRPPQPTADRLALNVKGAALGTDGIGADMLEETRTSTR
jgi:hypothetical protein